MAGKRKALSNKDKAALIMLSGKKLRSMEEAATPHEIIHLDPQTAQIHSAEIAHLHTIIGRIIKRLDKLEAKQ